MTAGCHHRERHELEVEDMGTVSLHRADGMSLAGGRAWEEKGMDNGCLEKAVCKVWTRKMEAMGSHKVCSREQDERQERQFHLQRACGCIRGFLGVLGGYLHFEAARGVGISLLTELLQLFSDIPSSMLATLLW